MRESVGERGVSVQKPKKLRLDPLADRRYLPRAAIVGRRGLICDGRFESEGITGRANHEGHRRPGRPTIGRAESGMAAASGETDTGKSRRPCADRGPSAYHTDAGKALSFGAAEPVNGRRWRLPGMRTRDLRLLKTIKTATVASTPLAI